MNGAIPALSVVHDAEQASCLVDPTRCDLLARLRQPESAASLARQVGAPRQRVNYHLRELERVGLAHCVGERRKGNCTERVLRATARAYVISPDVLGAIGATAAAAGDRLSAAALVGAAAETIRSVAALDRRATAEGKRFATLTLDTDIRFGSAEARAAFAAELTDAVARLAARFHDESAVHGRTYRLVVGVHPRVAAGAPAAQEHDDHA